MNPETGELDLGELFPALRTYCPILYGSPSIHEHPLQCLFLLRNEEEVFYGGAAGGGKSAALLAAGLQYVDVPGYRALILRRTFTQLSKGDALIPLSQEWLSQTDARWNEQKHRWTFPSGATLEFGHVKDETAKYDYQGAAYHFVGFDELTQFPESVYEYIAFSRQRRRIEMARRGIPVRVRATANPGGIGHGWVKKRFITERSAEVLYIPARHTDNPGLDHDDYAKRLRKLNPMLAAQLLDGDWGAFEGQAYPHFDRAIHVVPPVELPDHWQRFESMDYGLDAPTAWHLYAVDTDGNLLVADSYYRGKAWPSDHAAEVLARRRDWWEAKQDGWPVRHPCYGDPESIRERVPVKDDFGQPMTVQDIYQQLGVRIVPANNRRRVGYVTVAQALKPDPQRLFPGWHPLAGKPGSPKLFFVGERCPELVEQVENAPLASEETDPERGNAVDRRWESGTGHAHASLRYGLTTWTKPSAEPEPEITDPRQALLDRRRKRRQSPPDESFVEL